MKIFILISILLSCASYPPLKGNGSKEDDPTIKAILRKNPGPMRRCYEEELSKDESLAGEVRATFTINADGSVSDAEVSRELGEKLANCMEGELLDLKFPKILSGKTISVGQPYNFYKR